MSTFAIDLKQIPPAILEKVRGFFNDGIVPSLNVVLSSFPFNERSAAEAAFIHLSAPEPEPESESLEDILAREQAKNADLESRLKEAELTVELAQHAELQAKKESEKYRTDAYLAQKDKSRPIKPGEEAWVQQQLLKKAEAAEKAERERDSKKLPDPLHEDAYYGLAGRHLRNIEENSEAHPAGILGTFLAGFGSMVGRRAFTMVEDTLHYPSINVLVTGNSSRSRKDTAAGRALRPLKEAEPTWKRDIHQSFGSGEALTGYFAHKFKNKQDIRLLVLDTEFKSTLNICGRQGNTLSENYRRLFNGDPLENIVKKLVLFAPYTCGSIVGAITLGELQETLKQVEIESGFINRFMTLLIHRVRRISRPGVATSDMLTERAAIVGELKGVLEWVGKHEGDVQGIHAGEPLLGILVTWDEEAGLAWDNFYNSLEDDDPEYLNRAEVFVLRTSMIYALLDKSTVMRLEHLKAALAVWEYAKQSATIAYGGATSPDVKRLVSKAISCHILKRGAVSNFYGRNKNAEELDWLMEEAARLSDGRLSVVRGFDKYNNPCIKALKSEVAT